MNAADRGHQTRRERNARTSLGLGIHHIQVAEKTLRLAELDALAGVLRRLIDDATDIYHGLLPDRDRAAS